MKFLFTQVLIGMGSLDFSEEKKTENTKNTTNVSWKQSFWIIGEQAFATLLSSNEGLIFMIY